jgi:hypothetical protein
MLAQETRDSHFNSRNLLDLLPSYAEAVELAAAGTGC